MESLLKDDIPFEGIPRGPFEKEERQVGSALPTRPSEFVRFAVTVRVVEEGKPPKMEKFSFKERPYLLPVYDSPHRQVLLKCGRQVEKSTTLGNMVLAYSCLISGFQTLFVSPSRDQTITFSRDRLKEPMETGADLAAWTTQKLSDSIMLKKFVNRSQIVLRYAYHTADRVRGIPTDMVLIDEVQDINIDHIPVIRECASHSPYKIFRYSGTPKSMDNTIEYYWTEQSTQNEWVVPCHRHTPAYWNILGERNIGRKGLICQKCGELINPADPKAQWAAMNKYPNVEEPFEGFRIPQLMVPWITWSEILHKHETYSRVKFFNEVLGISYDSGTRPLTQKDITQNCVPEILMHDEDCLAAFRQQKGFSPVYAGIDWGTGEKSYTVVTLGTYMRDKFVIFYIHRFTGSETEPDAQLALLKRVVRAWDVRIVGVDYGGGFYQNDELIRTFGVNKIQKYQYLAPRTKVTYDSHLKRWMVNRSEVMSDVFNAIKRGNVFRFPRWEDFYDPYAKDMLNIFSEYNERRRVNEYKHSPAAPDDSFHSIVYCFLASMLDRPRPDVIAPRQARRQGALPK